VDDSAQQQDQGGRAAGARKSDGRDFDCCDGHAAVDSLTVTWTPTLSAWITPGGDQESTLTAGRGTASMASATTTTVFSIGKWTPATLPKVSESIPGGCKDLHRICKVLQAIVDAMDACGHRKAILSGDFRAVPIIGGKQRPVKDFTDVTRRQVEAHLKASGDYHYVYDNFEPNLLKDSSLVKIRDATLEAARKEKKKRANRASLDASGEEMLKMLKAKDLEFSEEELQSTPFWSELVLHLSRAVDTKLAAVATKLQQCEVSSWTSVAAGDGVVSGGGGAVAAAAAADDDDAGAVEEPAATAGVGAGGGAGDDNDSTNRGGGGGGDSQTTASKTGEGGNLLARLMAMSVAAGAETHSDLLKKAQANLTVKKQVLRLLLNLPVSARSATLLGEPELVSVVEDLDLGQTAVRWVVHYREDLQMLTVELQEEKLLQPFLKALYEACYPAVWKMLDQSVLKGLVPEKQPQMECVRYHPGDAWSYALKCLIVPSAASLKDLKNIPSDLAFTVVGGGAGIHASL